MDTNKVYTDGTKTLILKGPKLYRYMSTGQLRFMSFSALSIGILIEKLSPFGYITYTIDIILIIVLGHVFDRYMSQKAIPPK